MLVAFCVLLVDLFLTALIFYWNLNFNPLVVINIVIAIGLSVDYSAHISHSYLITEVPDDKAYRTKEAKTNEFSVYKPTTDSFLDNLYLIPCCLASKVGSAKMSIN